MTHTGAPVFEPAVQKANRWLNRLLDRLQWSERERGLRAFRVVMHSLRDQLTLAEVADLSAQLPLVLRGHFFEGWRPERTRDRIRSLDEFVDEIARQMPDEPFIDVPDIARAVFGMIAEFVSAGEVADLRSVLPPAIRTLWDSADQATAVPPQ